MIKRNKTCTLMAMKIAVGWDVLLLSLVKIVDDLKLYLEDEDNRFL
jgi:hypothetical protein